MKRTALVCLGMHRSGTSATTGVLQLLGVELGERLTAGHKGINDLGYFEHGDILDLHDAILGHLDSSWDSVLPLPEQWWGRPELAGYRKRLDAILERDFGNSGFWAVKDPRMCRLMPLWLKTLDDRGDEIACLLILRAPSEVAASLQRRDAMSLEKANHLWLEHYLLAEKWTRGRKRAFLMYDDLLRDPVPTLQRIAEALDITWPRTSQEAAADINNFLRSDLRHHRASDGRPASFDSLSATSLAEATFELLAGAGVEGPDPDAMAIAQQRFADRLAAFDPAVVDDLRHLAAERARLRAFAAEIYQSWSWKVVKPFRIIEKQLQRVRQG